MNKTHLLGLLILTTPAIAPAYVVLLPQPATATDLTPAKIRSMLPAPLVKFFQWGPENLQSRINVVRPHAITRNGYTRLVFK
ncbi:MAG TPA: hypothetical protein VLG71_01845 [Candidatus Limnocylindria bacterium]|nr:hypothetical protein [Candidatus Limnocylindria bacterium]